METLFGEDRIDGLVARFHALPGWPANPSADRAWVAQLVTDYPQIDIGAEIARWWAWKADHPERTKRKERPRVGFSNWCVNAARRRRGEPIGRGSRTQRAGRVSSVAGGAPAGPGAFPTSGRVSF